MLTLDFKVTNFFFDRDIVLTRMEKGRYRALSKFGGLTRIIARRSIRKAGKKTPPSPPGRPPRSRTGRLREGILYAYDPRSGSAVIGPTLYNQVFLRNGRPQRGTVPEVLEYGGRIGIIETNRYGGWQRRDLRYNMREGEETRVRFVDIAAHPFMKPAFDTALRQLPSYLRDLI